MLVKRVALRPLLSFAIATFLVAIPLAWYGFGYWSLVAMQAADIIRQRGDAGPCCTDAPRPAELLTPCFFRALAAEPWVHFESTFCLSLTERRQVHHRPRSRYGNTRHLHTGFVRRDSGDDSLRKYRPPFRLSRNGACAGRQGEASERPLESLLRTRAPDATCQRILRDLLEGDRRSSARAQMAHGRRAIRDLVRGVVFLPRLAQLCHALSGARTSELGNWRSHLPGRSTHCRYLVGGAPWTYGVCVVVPS